MNSSGDLRSACSKSCPELAGPGTSRRIFPAMFVAGKHRLKKEVGTPHRIESMSVAGFVWEGRNDAQESES